jgi:hypothetical protein
MPYTNVNSLSEVLIKHYVDEMLMQNHSTNLKSLHFVDEMNILMIIFTDDYIRVLMRTKKHSFSKNFKYDYISTSIESENEIPLFIRREIKLNSGEESKNMIDDWYEWKKVIIRDKKISDLGIE